MKEEARTIEALERRLAALEDQMAILQLLAAYGPAVDGLDRDGVAALFAEDGSYDFGSEPLRGRGAVATLIDLPSHRAYVKAGAAHTLTLPRIEVEGNRAVAINYSQVFVKAGGQWRADRTSANRWELARTAEGWKVKRRVNRLLDGSPGAREVLSLPAKGARQRVPSERAAGRPNG
jgi:hypothetical protein